MPFRPARFPFLFALPVCLLAACSGGTPTPTVGSNAPPDPNETVPSSDPETANSRDPDPPAEEPMFTNGAPDSGDLPGWTPPARPEDPAACRTLLQAQAAASGRHAKLPAYGEKLHLEPLPCVAAKGGVWGLVETITGYDRNPFDVFRRATCDGDEGDPCLYDAHVSVVPTFVTSAGKALSGSAFAVTTFYERAPSSLDVGAFDFDGDGSDELISSFDHPVILTVKGDQVVPYAPADKLSFSKIADIDQDGRPDLQLTNPYFVSVDKVGCGKPGGQGVIQLVAEVSVVARSLPNGTFSTSDPAAVAITKAECPGAPKSIVEKDRSNHFDNQRIRRNIVCARIWGVPAQTVIKSLDAGCTWPSSPTEDCDALMDARNGKPTSVCAGRQHLVAWANKTPPVSLK